MLYPIHPVRHSSGWALAARDRPVKRHGLPESVLEWGRSGCEKAGRRSGARVQLSRFRCRAEIEMCDRESFVQENLDRREAERKSSNLWSSYPLEWECRAGFP